LGKAKSFIDWVECKDFWLVEFQQVTHAPRSIRVCLSPAVP